MSKKQTTLMVANETVAVPAAQDFVIDGDRAKISVQVFTLTGTAPTVSAIVTELIEKGFTLAYDAQTANFTVGRTLVGVHSNARGVIMDDTDAGATGTLELKKVVGQFYDNEPLREEIAGAETSGAALANGRLVRVLITDGIWGTTAASISGGEIELVNPDRIAGEADRYDVYPRRFRLSISKAASVWTAAQFSVDLIQSGV